MSFYFRSLTDANASKAITSRSIFLRQRSTLLSREEIVGAKCK